MANFRQKYSVLMYKDTIIDRIILKKKNIMNIILAYQFI